MAQQRVIHGLTVLASPAINGLAPTTPMGHIRPGVITVRLRRSRKDQLNIASFSKTSFEDLWEWLYVLSFLWCSELAHTGRQGCSVDDASPMRGTTARTVMQMSDTPCMFHRSLFHLVLRPSAPAILVQPHVFFSLFFVRGGEEEEFTDH